MANTPDDNINYSGPSKEYKPDYGNTSGSSLSSPSTQSGYHNLDGLRDILDRVIKETDFLISKAENNLSKYSLSVAPDSRLEAAHKVEWPASMGEPKDYISYQEYKALGSVNTRGAEYVRKVYEDYVRGPNGTNSVDIILGASAVKTEALNIQGFLDDSIGSEVGDSSQQRTLELLQDWAGSALDHTGAFRLLMEKRTQGGYEAAASELDSINESEAAQYQALFKIKVNALNTEIAKTQEDLNREHNARSEIYYKRFLGPSIKFRDQVNRKLETNLNSTGQIASQARSAMSAVDASIYGLLTDQLKRNESFSNKIGQLVSQIFARDTHVTYIEQLSTKGKAIPSPFVEQDLAEDEQEGLEHYAETMRNENAEKNDFRSDHDDLLGRDSVEAHIQYFLRSGDNITGDITMDPDVLFDGMRPGLHRHRGIDVDGTPKIKGADIEDLVTTAIDRNEPICYPINLRHINNKPYTGTNNVTLVNSQIAWDCDPNMTFELQTVPVGVNPTPQAPSLDYCVTTLYETGLPIVAGLGSDFNFFTFCTSTAVYNYNWTNGLLTLIAGSEENYGDGPNGDSLVKARFSNIKDLAQDFFDGRIYIADGDNRKVKMTSKADTNGHVLPMDVTTVFTCPYNIKRLDTQGQNFLNTLYVVAGPDGGGKDRVYKLVDIDGNNLASGTYGATEIIKLSGVYSDIIDIAATPNGFVYILQGTNLYQYDPNINTVKTFDVADNVGTALPTAITSDQYGNVYITYSTI